MATYDGFVLEVRYCYPQNVGFFYTDRLKSRHDLTSEKAKEICGQSLLLWDGETIEFWVEPPAGERTLSLYVYAYSVGRVRVGVFEDGKSSWGEVIDTASNSTTEQWEKLELSFTADGGKNYFLRIEVLPYVVSGERTRQRAYINSLELK